MRSVDGHANWERAFLYEAATSIDGEFVFWYIKIFWWTWRILAFVNLLMVSCISTVSEVSVSVLDNTWLFPWNRSITREELALVIWERLISLHGWLADVCDTNIVFILFIDDANIKFWVSLIIILLVFFAVKKRKQRRRIAWIFEWVNHWFSANHWSS